MKHQEKEKRAQEVQAYVLKQRDMTQHTTLYAYLRSCVRGATLYTQWQRLLAYVRRLRLVALLLRVTTMILTVIETGALVLLSTAIFLIVLPILIALMLGVLLTALLESRRTNRLLAKESEGKRVYLLFLPREESLFFLANAQSLSQKENTLVLVVSPYWLSAKGLREGHFYCTAREEAPRLYLIRRYYFFSLQKKVLRERSTVFLY